MTALNERALEAVDELIRGRLKSGFWLSEYGIQRFAREAILAYHASEPDAVAVERGVLAGSSQQYQPLRVNAAGQVELDKDKVFWSDDGSIWCYIANLYDLAIRGDQP